MIVLHEMEKQVILYAQGRFNMYGGHRVLETMASLKYGVPGHVVERKHVFDMVEALYIELAQEGYLNYHLHDFLDGAFRTAWRSKGEHMIGYEDLIKYMLGEMGSINVVGLKLGEVDKRLIQK